ncbi:L,D-transpeptidase family protein [uncultured Cytophaga sp.]|uniref:L,D-transpeptidase family protein n=1 Tax=uncultured Cytophaga sp. TaxID=160238 RepID=UPI0026205F8C|nr:L,D-transpeptidase family protein [uncultured Cytophaga sp.]
MLKPVLVILLLIGFYSCSRKVQPSASHKTIDTIAKEKSIVPFLKKDLFEQTNFFVATRIVDIDKNNVGNKYFSVFVSSNDSIFNLYKKNEYQLFWGDEKKFQRALDVLKESKNEGLDPEDYHVNLLTKEFESYKLKDSLVINDAVSLELLMSKSMYTYINHLHFGRVDPITIYPEWNYKRPSEAAVSDSNLVDVFNNNVTNIAPAFRPKIFFYESLRKALIESDSLEVYGFGAKSIPYIGRKLQKGDTSFIIVEIKKRLNATTQYDINAIDNVFNDDLVSNIKIFQAHVGLKPTGIIDKTTLNKINYTPNEIRNTIRANMERCRWFNEDIDSEKEFVLINIPDYTLSYFKNGKVDYSERIIVGRVMNQTPVFESKIATVEFNPYWTVPKSIAVKEILPSLKKDPSYLEKHNMVLYQGADIVETPASFDSYTEKNFPFVIKENPGEKNSLGQVKFLFPNPYSIYMHDTPAKYLFDNDVRSFSHGCIRLHDPIKFANYLLSKEGFKPSQIQDILKSDKNYAIALKTKIPIMISYFTCYMKKGDSRLYFFSDIYGSDKKIINALD